MTVFAFLSFIAFAAYVYIGIYVYLMDSKKTLNRFLVLICACFAVWSLSRIAQYLAYPDEPVVWIKLSVVGSSSYASFFLHFALLWTGRTKLTQARWIYPVLYLPSALFTLSGLIMPIGSADWETRGILLFIYHLIYSTSAFVLIFRWGRKATYKREKIQAQFIFYTGVTSMSLMILNNLVKAMLSHVLIPMLPHLMVLVTVWGIWFCMSRYKFLGAASFITASHILDHVTDMVVVTDPKGNVQRVNYRVCELLGYSVDELMNKPVLDILHPGFPVDFNILCRSDEFSERMQYCDRYGQTIPARVIVRPLRDMMDDIVGIVFIGQDMRLVNQLEQEVKERIKAEERLSYISMHDSLTGLHNRTWFEMEIGEIRQKKPGSVGLVLCDLDGLKLINDTMGHASGDKLLVLAAQLFRNAYTHADRISRIGGDEFAILLTECARDQILAIVTRIHEELRVHNEGSPRVPVSISVGYAYSENGDVGVEQIFKEADNNMYKAKLNNKMSSRNAVVRALEGTLSARDRVMDSHAERIESWAIELAKDIGMQEHELMDIRLFARFHDIGKVGIPDRILLKEGPLTEEEYAEMKRHSEIGFHIAQSTPDLTHIALWILKHHEWWNGKGYLLGLKGETIPIQCRIISIVDAFDAMTHDRTYRKAMSVEQALEELVRCAGSQFDPKLTELFVRLIRSGESATRNERDAAAG